MVLKVIVGSLGALWGSYNMYMRYIWPFSVDGHFQITQCTCLRMVRKSKIAGKRAKTSEIWDSMLIVICIWGTFDLLVFKLLSFCKKCWTSPQRPIPWGDFFQNRMLSSVGHRDCTHQKQSWSLHFWDIFVTDNEERPLEQRKPHWPTNYLMCLCAIQVNIRYFW